jgi:hypothetical protein
MTSNKPRRGKGSRQYLSERPAGFVYGLKSNNSDVYFYIGSTTQTLHRRLRGHFRPDNRNKELQIKLESLGRENVVIELIEQAPTKERFTREYALIAEYKAKGHPLLNMVLSDEPPVWVRTPQKNIRDFVILVENCQYNDSWVSWVVGCYVRNFKRHCKREEIGTEIFERLHALPDPPEQPMPTAEDVFNSYLDLFRAGNLKDGVRVFKVVCQFFGLNPKFGAANV